MAPSHLQNFNLETLILVATPAVGAVGSRRPLTARRYPTALAATSFLPSLARQHCDLHCLLPDMGQHTGSGAASLAAHHLRWVSFLPPTFPVGPADSDNPNPNRPCLVF
jgi:hypothetical protein